MPSPSLYFAPPYFSRDYFAPLAPAGPPPPPPPPTGADRVWVDDAPPAGSSTFVAGGSWAWSASDPPSFSGSLSYQGSGAPQAMAFFEFPSPGEPVGPGDTLYAYVFVDPASPPSEVMLQWTDGSSWGHAAYWGADMVPWQADGGPPLFAAGALPAPGAWARLEVSAADVSMAGAYCMGVALTVYGGRACFDDVGASTPASPFPPPPPVGPSRPLASRVVLRRHASYRPPPDSDFWVSVRKWFAADPALTAAFPGGAGHGPVGAATPMPYARLVEKDVATGITMEDYAEEAGFEVYAHDDDEAKAVADLLVAKLDQTSSRPPFAFGGYSETAHKPLVAGKPQFVSYVGGGNPLWQSTFTFRFWLTKVDQGDPLLPW